MFTNIGAHYFCDKSQAGSLCEALSMRMFKLD